MRPVTAGRRFGLGRNFPTPREHCKRCAEITSAADQMVLNYVMANVRQVDIINRLMKDPDGATQVVALGQLLAEKDSLLDSLRNIGNDEVRTLIDQYREEAKVVEGQRDSANKDA